MIEVAAIIVAAACLAIIVVLAWLSRGNRRAAERYADLAERHAARAGAAAERTRELRDSRRRERAPWPHRFVGGHEDARCITCGCFAEDAGVTVTSPSDGEVLHRRVDRGQS